MNDKILLIKELRQLTGVGLNLCKDALEKSLWVRDQAIEYLREKGLVDFATRLERKTSEGRVMSYIHGDGKVGVLLQVNCETDFVAKSEEFTAFMHELCLQIAGASPVYVSSDDVPNEVRKNAYDNFLRIAKESGKKQEFLSKIASGQLEKYYSQVCLLDQAWVKDKDKKVKDLLVELSQKTGEMIKVVKFSRFTAGSM